MLAIIREVVRRCFGILPYNTQMISVLALLSQPEKSKGRVAQILTGEGKSTIIAVAACYLALRGDFVDIITSSHYLAVRDQKKNARLYEMLGLTSSHICYTQPIREHFNGQILYGTNTDFEFSLMRDALYGLELRRSPREGRLVKRTTESVIVDEVDNLLLDMALNSARLAVSAPEHTSWVYEPLYKNLEAGLPQTTGYARNTLR